MTEPNQVLPNGPTNYSWALSVLSFGGWPQTANNQKSILDWNASEQSHTSLWWTGGSPNPEHVNPLNNGLGSGGGGRSRRLHGPGDGCVLRGAERRTGRQLRGGGI